MTSIIRLTFCILLAYHLAFSQGERIAVQLDEDEKTATVSLRVCMMSGLCDLVIVDDIRFINLGSGEDYGDRFRDRIARDIPFGEYEIEVTMSGFGTTSQSVTVDQPHTLIATAFWSVLPGFVERAYTYISGRTSPTLFHTEDRWAKIVSVYSDFVKHASISEGGFFWFDKISSGEYFVYVFDGDCLIGQQKVTAQLKPTVIEIQ
jgi:hypothetical protein